MANFDDRFNGLPVDYQPPDVASFDDRFNALPQQQVSQPIVTSPQINYVPVEGNPFGTDVQPPIPPKFQRAVNRMFGIGGEERYQFFPEKIVRSIAESMNDPSLSVEKGLQRPSETALEGAFNAAGLAGGSSFAIKPGVATLGSGAIRPALKAAEVAPPFYSALEKAVDAIAQPKMLGKDWLGTLSNKPGVKPEELGSIGLDSFLKENADKVLTKADVQKHVAENKTVVNEVDKLSDAKKTKDQLIQENMNRGYTREEAETTADRQLNEGYMENMYPTSQTKYQSYQLPGGENYREKLFTLPSKSLNYTKDNLSLDIQASEINNQGRFWEIKAPDNVFQISKSKYPNPQDALNYVINEKKPNSYGLDNYQSSHWDEPNVLAHVRMNDRTIEGGKSLHIEEIQSDWHQAGRDKGYASQGDKSKFDELNTQLEQARVNLSDVMKQIRQESKLPSVHEAIAQKLSHEDRANLVEQRQKAYDADLRYNQALTKTKQLEEDLSQANPVNKVPDAPFKKSWHELVLKRAIREAAEGGYDRLSWTPGEAQAARYDLSKQVDHIDYRKNGDKYELGIVDKHGQGVSTPKQFYDEKELADVVGKEVAEKIINGEGQKGGGRTTLKNIDLKVGGEGMKGFYDKIIPKAVERLTGEKVKTTTVDTGNIDPKKSMELPAYDSHGNLNKMPTIREPVHYIDITPALRQKALSQGFPLFSSGVPVFTPVQGNPHEQK